MIGWLQGLVLHKQGNQVIMNVNGVGYEIAVPISILEQLPQGQAAELFIHHAQREDGQYLYGFASIAQRQLFRELIRISGIGPKLGLLVLSSFSVENFITIVRENNSNALLKLSGVGKKTAERLLIELKDRVGGNSAFTSMAGAADTPLPIGITAAQEAVEALMALELKPADAAKLVESALKQSPDADTAALIKSALQLKLQSGK